jgi:WD40 repeat protein
MREGSVYEFDGDTGKVTWRQRAAERLAAGIAYAPEVKEGKEVTRPVRFLAGGYEVTRVFEMATNDVVHTMKRHDRTDVTAVAVDPKGEYAATGGADHLVRLWDLKTGKMLSVLSAHTDTVLCLAFDHQGRWVASGGGDAQAIIWDAKAGQPLLKLEGHKISVHGLDWSHDDARLATSSLDSHVKIWSTRDGRLEKSVQPHGGFIYSVQWTPDGKELAAAGVEYSVKMWSAGGEWKLVRELAKDWDDTIHAVAFNEDRPGELAVGHRNGKVKTWSYANEALMEDTVVHRGKVFGMTYVTGGKYLVSVGEDSFVQIWDTKARQQYMTMQHDAPVRCAGGHPKEQVFATGDETGTVMVWRVGDKKTPRDKWVIGGLEAHGGVVTSVGFTPDGRQVVTASEDGTIKFWDMKNGKSTLEIAAHRGGVLCHSMHPSGEYVATSGKDKSVRVWRVKDGAQVYVNDNYQDEVTSVAYAPDGDRIASATMDGEIKILLRKRVE